MLMMQVNVFSGMNPEFVEESVNLWLRENPNIYLWKVLQSESRNEDYKSFTISVWYREAQDEPASPEG
jgi:hypothetical protein